MASNPERSQGGVKTRFVQLSWLIAAVCAVLSACAVRSSQGPQPYRFQTLPSGALATSVALPAAADGEDDVGAGERPLCDLAEMSVPLAPGACSVTPVDDAPAAPAKEAVSSAAPMCDPSASSIAAPVEIPEVDRGRLQPLPCDAAERLLSLLRSGVREGGVQLIAGDEGTLPPPRPSMNPFAGRDGTGIVAMLLEWPERNAPSTLSVTSHHGVARQLGHRRRVYRPPSAV